MHFIWFIILGGLAGWLAGILAKGRGFGLLGNILVGIIGAVLGGWLFGALGIYTNSLIGELATAVVGALVLIGIANIFGGRRR